MEVRKDLPPLPNRIARLPVDARGYPVPWFVAWIDGQPDFRVIGEGKMKAALKGRLCWICGGKLGRYLAFLIGPMCTINRTISEPPSHLECTEFSAKACPFLTRPKAHRREHNLPDDRHPAAGVGLERNPGVVLVWVTHSYRQFPDPAGRVLFSLGDPVSLQWFAEGRPATRAEVVASIESGLPLLREAAAVDGPAGLEALERQTAAAMELLPNEIAILEQRP